MHTATIRSLLLATSTVSTAIPAFALELRDNHSAGNVDAVIGQVSWEVAPGLTLQPGVRLNWDMKEGLCERRVFDGRGNPLFLVGTIRPESVNHYELGFKIDLPGSTGLIACQPGDPRTYGLTLAHNV